METARTLNDALGCDLVEVFTKDTGERCVWFLGYGIPDGNADGGFSWLHYLHNVAPLHVLIDNPGFDGAESNAVYNGEIPPSRESLDESMAEYYYSDAETEEPIPFFEFRTDIEDGYYIIRKRNAEVKQ